MHRILHCGFHKTGSTFLQRHVFPKLEDVIYSHGYTFGRLPTVPKESLKPILISSEAACGYPYPETPEFSVDDLLSSVRLLSITKVLLVTREFNNWVLSLYFQTLNGNSTWTLEEFVSKNRAALLTWKHASEQIKMALSEEGVEFLHLQQEILLEHPDKVIGEICSFIGTPKISVRPQIANPSRMGNITIKTYRILNKTYRFRVAKAIYRTGIVNPRKLIQHGRLGAITEKLSRRLYSAEDVKQLLP